MGNRELEPRLAGTAFPRVVLFDLDGTLLDSAPDMLAAINVLRGERGHAPATLEQLRPPVSKGARALILSAFPQPHAAARQALVQPFLAAYERRTALHVRPLARATATPAPPTP